MSKRNTTGSRPSRKRRKGANYTAIDLDAPDDSLEVEDIRVWAISTSETTGRASATRRNYKHFLRSSLEPLREEILTPEHSDVPADSESNELLPAKSNAKRRRVRTVKENDSVSPVLVHRNNLRITWQTRMEGWLPYRSAMLDEMLRLDGLGDFTALELCVSCTKSVGEYRCSDCFGDNMHCSGCILSSHRHLPLHRIQVRPGSPVSQQL